MYFIEREGDEPGGPYDVSQIQALIESGAVLPSTILRRQDTGARVAAREIEELRFQKAEDAPASTTRRQTVARARRRPSGQEQASASQILLSAATGVVAMGVGLLLLGRICDWFVLFAVVPFAAGYAAGWVSQRLGPTPGWSLFRRLFVVYVLLTLGSVALDTSWLLGAILCCVPMPLLCLQLGGWASLTVPSVVESKNWKLACLWGLVVAAPVLWWYVTPILSYPSGRDIESLHLDDRTHRRWAPSARERVADYCRRTGQPLAPFTGSIILNAPKSQDDGYELQIYEGNPTWGPDDSPRVKADIDRVRSSGLAAMLRVTQNDWRIYNYGGHYIDPQGRKFTGQATIPNFALPLMGGEIRFPFVVEFRDGKVVSARRSVGIGD